MGGRVHSTWRLAAAIALLAILLTTGLGMSGRADNASVHLPSSSSSPTDVCGGIYAATTWTRANSPYIATCDVTLFPGYTLTIEPGVEVRFSSGTGLEVRGALIAEGTATDRIVFTSDASSPAKGDWAGIDIATNLGGQASIAFTNFSYAQAVASVECCGNGGPVNISDSEFANNVVALGGYAGWDMVVERCTFDNNTYAVVRGDKRISESVFTNNDYGLGGYPNNWGTERVDVYASTFTGNDVALYGGRGEVKYCEISGNGTGVQPFYEGFSLRNNTIASNDVGVVLGQYDTYVEYNNIYGNAIYNLKNTGSSNKSVPNNWWGTTDTSQIDASIYDGYDDPSLGIVDYEPILTQPVDIGPPSPLLSNGSFEKSGSWRRSRTLTLKDRRVCNVAHDGSCSFRIVGTSARKLLRQVVRVSGSAGDRFTLRGWSRARDPSRTGGPYCLVARVFHTDGTKKAYRKCFAKRTHGWQYRERSFTVDKDYNKIVILLLYARQSGKAWFDDVKLLVPR